MKWLSLLVVFVLSACADKQQQAIPFEVTPMPELIIDLPCNGASTDEGCKALLMPLLNSTK